ncbi:Uncharacterised protein [Anaerococcus prevotii]|uniref:DUF6873 domain-containing protein n=1 Tax=Anaerococcus prevotii (strain ATCC 9321 / DSM 20548 / JCM 6508 / NCTC 11806 / PC1) TaxID=525919 RepID=C7RDX4_ANAPD|nr:hypothetical protein [Anaerococcus prevotii]ACV29387.1 hypothetical protein Apre_1364 [Anaerococcus prevotii DSM 20548]SUU95059.1 Uncharacterised protein [Anaerococcus prevotii]
MLIISNKASLEFKNFLTDQNIDFIETIDNPNLYKRIGDHPDLSLFVLDSENIILAEEVYSYYKDKLPGKNLIKGSSTSKKYPRDSIYNLLTFEDFYIHNDFTEENIERSLKERNYKHLFVKQGYSRCSIIPLRESLLTSDYGIYKSLRNKVNIILLDNDKIELDGFDQGFIGGTCGLVQDKLIFTGDISRHKSFELIKKACDRENIKIIYPETPLVDIGSLIWI